MDIYILREGQQTGPYDDEGVHTLLKDGAIKLDDFAWRDGLPNWQPLSSVLYPKSASGIFPPPPKDAPTPTPEPFLSPVAAAKQTSSAKAEKPASSEPSSVASTDPESATAKQKAFLTFLGIDFASSLTKERASLILEAATENPHKTERMKRWETEKLRLHPELFAEEIQAKKGNRAQHFLEICQKEGSEYFHDVTKAHTQVLVGYLDVQHPRWDERTNATRYLFAALAEKFPQLVKLAARGQLKYPGGPKAADEMERSGIASRPRKKSSPFIAMLRGVGIGLILLAALYGTKAFYEQHVVGFLHPAEETASASDGFPPTPPPLGSASLSSQAPAAPAAVPDLPVSAKPAEAPAAIATASPAPAADTPLAVAMTSTSPPAPAAVPEAAPAIPPTATTPPAPAAIPSLLEPAPVPAPPAPATPTPRTTVKITKPTSVTLRFGTSTLPAGAVVPIVSADAAIVMVRFGPDVVPIPVANTDLSTPPAP